MLAEETFNLFSTCPLILNITKEADGSINKYSFPSRRGGETMYWPIEYDERVRVKGFSILDDDFDCMARDIGDNVRKDPRRNKIGESLATVLKVAKSRWQGTVKLNAASLSDS
jgi:hypothetical protein